MFGEAPTGSDGGAAGASEIVTIGAGDAFNDAELAQACELSGQGSGRAPGKHWQEVGAAESGDVEARTLQGREQGLFDAVKKFNPLTLRPLMTRGWVRRWRARMPAEKSSRLESYSR